MKSHLSRYRAPPRYTKCACGRTLTLRNFFALPGPALLAVRAYTG